MVTTGMIHSLLIALAFSVECASLYFAGECFPVIRRRIHQHTKRIGDETHAAPFLVTCLSHALRFTHPKEPATASYAHQQIVCGMSASPVAVSFSHMPSSGRTHPCASLEASHPYFSTRSGILQLFLSKCVTRLVPLLNIPLLPNIRSTAGTVSRKV